MIICMGHSEINAEFHVLDIDTRYNLLLGRSFIHMARVVPSTLHRLIKLVLKEQELVIHGEGSHSSGHAPMINEVSQCIDFYTQELVISSGDDFAPQPPLSCVVKMVFMVMLKNGFEKGFGLRRNFKGIVNPIQVPVKEASYGLGYVPTDVVVIMRKNNYKAFTRTIHHMYQSFPLRQYVDCDKHGEGIYSLFEDTNTIIEDEFELGCICDVELGAAAKLDLHTNLDSTNIFVRGHYLCLF